MHRSAIKQNAKIDISTKKTKKKSIFVRKANSISKHIIIFKNGVGLIEIKLWDTSQ